MRNEQRKEGLASVTPTPVAPSRLARAIKNPLCPPCSVGRIGARELCCDAAEAGDRVRLAGVRDCHHLELSPLQPRDTQPQGTVGCRARSLAPPLDEPLRTK